MSRRTRRAAAAAVACLALAPAATAAGTFPGLPGNWTHAEINVTVNGESHTLVYDRGRIRSVAPDSLVLREADGSVVTVPVDVATVVTVDGVRRRLRAVRVGMFAVTRRVDGAAADRVWATTTR
jgi:hypothetical protein